MDCKNCKHSEENAIFKLCKHPQSVYVVSEKMDWHTQWHMRHHSHCGKEAKLYEPEMGK